MGENQSKSQNNGGNASQSSTQARSTAHNVVRASHSPQMQQRQPQSSEETIQQRQRRFYEQRLREAQQELERTAEERALDELLRQQVQAVERSLAQQQLSQDGHSSPQAQVLERNRTPYNLTQGDLQRNRESFRPASQNASPTLYPNLNVNHPLAQSSSYNLNPTAQSSGYNLNPTAQSSGYNLNPTAQSSGYNLNPTAQGSANTPRQRNDHQDLDSYVFVNSNLQSPVAHMSNFSPSAPPAPTLNSGNQTRGPNKQINKNKPAVSSSRPADCSTCGQPYGLGKIYQCAGDKRSIRHSSCVNCKADNRRCGICDSPISDMRNLGLETKLGDLKVPCPYNCDRQRLWSTIGAVDTIDDHKKECPMRFLQCPVFGPSQCTWTGKINNLSSHINDVHPDCRRSVDTEITLNNITDPIHTKSFIELDGTGPFKFLFHTKINAAERKIFMAVQLYSARNDKNTWFYEIHVFNKREPRRKFLYKDVCQPSYTPIDDIFGQYKCVSIPTSYAMTFVNDGSLTYKIYIKSNYQQSEPSNSGWKGRKDNRKAAS